MRVLLAAVLAVLVAAGGALAFAGEGEGETVTVVTPEGYKVASTKQEKGLIVHQMIPEGETLDNWQEMLVVQIFPFGGVEMLEYEAFYRQRKLPMCDETSTTLVQKGREYGYDFALFNTSCSTAPAARRETVLIKAILGKDRTFVVAKTWRFAAGEAEMATWTQYLEGVSLCDSRIAGVECPENGMGGS
ncbi:hypothetical protein [uncultured Microbulbifer sp.]|uniref:hypothetical protein n=1 Tax=uncultured Microbulbifer sp. TaxID=348147 RepID=UPI002632F80C|nr:hypothetical protein [uncultured Microbulbifer sp.]